MKNSDEEIEKYIIASGGLEKFRLVQCPDYKIVSQIDDLGTRHDLIIENDALYDGLIKYLERKGVQISQWNEI